MGVSRERLSFRIRTAVSKPSISGMRTSSRMIAKSLVRICLRASLPALTATTLRSAPLSSSCIASKLRGSSSTTSTFAFGTLDMGGSGGESYPQQRQQLLDVHGLGNVVGSSRLDALLPISLHRLGGHRDDRQVPEFLQAAHDPYGVV